MKIVIIGSGNLATQLALALKDANQEIVQIFSRTLANANSQIRLAVLIPPLWKPYFPMQTSTSSQ